MHVFVQKRVNVSHRFVPGLMSESPGRRFFTAIAGPVGCLLGSNPKYTKLPLLIKYPTCSPTGMLNI